MRGDLQELCHGQPAASFAIQHLRPWLAGAQRQSFGWLGRCGERRRSGEKRRCDERRRCGRDTTARETHREEEVSGGRRDRAATGRGAAAKSHREEGAMAKVPGSYVKFGKECTFAA